MINYASFDLSELDDIDTSFEFVEKIFKNLSISLCSDNNFLSSSLYFQRHLVQKKAESFLESRRLSLSAVPTSSHQIQPPHRFLEFDNLSVLECASEDRTSSLLLDSDDGNLDSVVDFQNVLSHNRLFESNPKESVSAFYILSGGFGHFSLHLRPASRTASLDVFSLSSFEFESACNFVAMAFDVWDGEKVKVYSSCRTF